MVAMIVPMALATGMTPFAGQNSGAERMDRVHRAVRLALRFDLAGGVVVYALLALLAWPAARLFTPDPEVQEVIVAFVRISMTVLALDVLVHLAVATFNGLRRPARAATAQVLYLLVFIVPATLLGSWLYDLHGVFAGLAVGSALAGLVAWRWLLAIGGEHAGAPTGGGAQRR